jgi:branched-subunit amino acid transport protein
MSLTQVQQWVISVLAFTVIEHFAAGLAVAAIFADDKDAQVGLNVLAGVSGVVAVAAFRALRGKSMLSVWLLLGPLPGVVGAWLTFR